MYEYAAKAVRVVDGDTAQLDIDLGLKIHRVENCRLAGINTPELTSPDTAQRAAAQAAKERLAQLIMDVPLRVESKVLDKYGRPLVAIWLPAGQCVNQILIDEGHAQPMLTYGVYWHTESAAIG